MVVSRADRAVVEAGLAPTRTQAKVLIKAGLVLQKKIVTGQGKGAYASKKIVTRPAEMVEASSLLLAPEANSKKKFVSRAGDKLEACLVTPLGADHVFVDGCRALDVGASTGGFTDCLLQRGAREVVAIDVGHGQLHPRIASHPRVVSFEGINARSVTADDLQSVKTVDIAPTSNTTCIFDLVVIDVSFISLTLVLPNVWKLLNPKGGVVVALVKPQFEVGGFASPEGMRAVQKGRGIITDATLRRRALDAVLGLTLPHQEEHPELDDAHVAGFMESPVVGSDGNHEWLLVLTRGKVSERRRDSHLQAAPFT